MPSSVPIPALVTGTPARCPGVPPRPLPAPPWVPAARAKEPSHRRLGWCGPGIPCHLPAASAHRGNADCPAGGLDPLGPLSPFHFRGPPGRVVAAQRCWATPPFAPKRPCWPHQTDPSFMLQCCNISATEGEKRPRSQTKHKNWCVTHLLGYLQSPNCLPGVYLAEAVRCLSLFFPRKKMD